MQNATLTLTKISPYTFRGFVKFSLFSKYSVYFYPEKITLKLVFLMRSRSLKNMVVVKVN